MRTVHHLRLAALFAILFLSPALVPSPEAATAPTPADRGASLDEVLALARAYLAEPSTTPDRLSARLVLYDWHDEEIRRAFALLHRSAKELDVELQEAEALALMHARCSAMAADDGDEARAGIHAHHAQSFFDWTRRYSRALERSRRSRWRPRLQTTPFYASLAASLHARWHLELAMRVASHGLELEPKDPLLLYVAGCIQEGLWFRERAARRSGAASAALAAAERFFHRSLAEDPSRDDARLRLAHVLVEKRNEAEARPLLDALTRPELPPRLRHLAWLLLGRLHEQAGDWRQAADAYARAIEAEPAHQAARLARAFAVEQQSGVAVAHHLVLEAVAEPTAATDEEPWASYPFGPHTLAREWLLGLEARLRAEP